MRETYNSPLKIIDQWIACYSTGIFLKSLCYSWFDHALSLIRPFLLRFLMMFRPAFVDILFRKPCFIFRRRLFG